MRLADFDIRYGGAMDRNAILVGIAVSLLLVVVVAGILATVEWLAVRKALGLAPSNKLGLRFRKAFHAFKHTRM